MMEAAGINCAVLAAAEVGDDRLWMFVVVQRQAREEIEPAPAAPSDTRICRFDYRRDVSIVAIHVSLNKADGGGGKSNPRKISIALPRGRSLEYQVRSLLLATFAPANRLHDVESRQQPYGEARTMAGRGQRG